MELLKKLLDKKASEDNTICLNAYAKGIIDSKASELLEMLKILIQDIEEEGNYSRQTGYDLEEAKKLIEEIDGRI